MNKPYIILHMLLSLDGKVTGDYMKTQLADELCQEYYRINREYKADGFACGRITMEESFTHGKKPNLTKFAGVKVSREDYVAKVSNFYAVSIDPRGKLGWSSCDIVDEDPGYDKAHVIEVLTQSVSDEYIAFLKEMGISYVFCGDKEINLNLLNEKLFSLFGIKTLLVEGGGVTNGGFLNADSIDEMSLVLLPMVDGGKGVDLFCNKNCGVQSFELKSVKPLSSGGLWLNYIKKKN